MQLFIPVFDGHRTLLSTEFFGILLHVLVSFSSDLSRVQDEKKRRMSFHWTLFTYEKKNFLGVARKFRGWKGVARRFVRVRTSISTPLLLQTAHAMIWKIWCLWFWRKCYHTIIIILNRPPNEAKNHKKEQEKSAKLYLVGRSSSHSLTHEFEIFHENFLWRVKAHILKGKNFISNCVSLFR